VKITILAVGKVKERGIREAIDDYLGRAKRHFPIDEVEVKDAPPAQLAPVLEKRLPEGAHAVALDVAGTARSSEQFARWLDGKASQGKGHVVFLIGGADGLPPTIIARAAEKISLSAMTFPHRLARLVLAEQLYRAVTILRNEPYARL
jgi:23S rRNA (pseudouridine1915-N3)-methyltransferase